MSATDRGLGRGLDALFRNSAMQSGALRQNAGDGEEEKNSHEDSTKAAITRLPIAALSPAQGQPRVTFDEEALQELAESIRSQGVVQPLLVRPFRTETATIYEIVAGERRWRAARMAGLEEVPVFIRDMSDEDALTAALIENLQREDLNPLEEALAIQTLRDRLAGSQEELAKRLGKSRSAVANALRLLQLPETMREALRDGSLSPGHARALLALPEEDLREVLFEAIVQAHLSVRDAEAAVVYWKRHGVLPPAVTGAAQSRPKNARTEKSETIKRMILGLRSAVHPKATIAGTDKIGRITLPYESAEQLAHLLARLGASADEEGRTPLEAEGSEDESLRMSEGEENA